MVAADTNVLVRYLIQDEPVQYKKAVAALEDGAWVSHVVLMETIWVLQDIYDTTPKMVCAVLRVLLKLESVVLEDEDTVLDALQEYEKKPKLGFSDCMILAIARTAGHTPLVTFDKALSKLIDVELIR